MRPARLLIKLLRNAQGKPAVQPLLNEIADRMEYLADENNALKQRIERQRLAYASLERKYLKALSSQTTLTLKDPGHSNAFTSYNIPTTERG